MANAIIGARRASGLTQAQLGQRIGLKGRAIWRWERDESAPSKRNQAALVTALTSLNPSLGEWFLKATATAPEEPKPATVAAPSAAEVLERAVFAFADELDLPARRARGALKRLIAQFTAANLSVDVAQKLLAEWIQRVE